MSLTRKAQALLAAIVLVAGGSVAFARMQAGEERSIPYQGVLEHNGVASDGPVTLRFSLFDSAVAGTQVWMEEQVVDVDNGRFAVVLGDGDGFLGDSNGDVLDEDVLDTPALFLEIAVVDGTTLTTLSPRQEIVPVPLAARAANADRAAIAENATRATTADNATRATSAASVAAGSITRASLANDVRFAAAIDHTPAAGSFVTSQLPANWVRVTQDGVGNVVVSPTPAQAYICVASSVVPGVIATVERANINDALHLRVRLQNAAGVFVNAGFNIICELP